MREMNNVEMMGPRHTGMKLMRMDENESNQVSLADVEWAAARLFHIREAFWLVCIGGQHVPMTDVELANHEQDMRNRTAGTKPAEGI